MPVSAPTSITPDTIFREATLARKRIASIDGATRIDRVELPSGVELLLKREDLSRVHSFKWRGAANRIAVLRETGDTRAIVAASAGNHAQGVALAAATFGVDATIYMPRSTPRVKQADVRRFGGSRVTVVLEGDKYDEASLAAKRFARESGAAYVHPYDDPLVIAGQATIADEIVQDCPAPSRVYLCVGGGGLAAGVATVLRAHWPTVELIGVEATGQASMAAAIEAGEPVDIGVVDGFCDGTAVRRAGDLTHALCSELLDRTITVTNDEVCAAIEYIWRTLRAVPEPSGALGIAAALKEDAPGAGPALTVISGANVDFMTLPRIARRAHIGSHVRKHYAFTIDETAGSLIGLLERIGDEFNIVEFQYGKTDERIAHPVIGFEAAPSSLDRLADAVRAGGVKVREVTGHRTIDHRVIPARPDLFHDPVFATVSFPDRSGALREFMRRVGDVTSICYFNYITSGETRGEAIMGFEFASPEHKAAFLGLLETSELPCRMLGHDECRMLASTNTPTQGSPTDVSREKSEVQS